MAALVHVPVEECVEWLARCMGRLVALHPDCSLEDGRRIAMGIWADERWRRMDPEQAVDLLFPNAVVRLHNPRPPLPMALMPPLLRSEQLLGDGRLE
jgi:hypothetical protein